MSPLFVFNEDSLAVTPFFSYFLSPSDVPQSILSLGTSLNGSNIKEGDDVYFECSVRANPRPYKITWRFNVSILERRRDETHG